MSLADGIRIEQRVVEVYDLAIAALVTDFAISFNEAAQLLLGCAMKDLTPSVISEVQKKTAAK